MYNSQRYRCIAEECLKAAHNAEQPRYRALFLSMASTWLSLANQDEAINGLLASWGMVEAES
jgi:hypothetical protein